MKRVAIGLIVLFMAGCGISYQVTADALADAALIPHGFPVGTSFAIAPVEEENPLFVKQVAHKIAAALERQGYAVREEADYRLLFSCKMTHEKFIVNETEYFPRREDRKDVVKDSKGEISYKKESTKSSGEWREVAKERIRYTRELSIRVLDEGKEVWSGSATSVGQTGDLREAVDYLLFPVMNHFGLDTGKKLVSTISEKDLEEAAN